MHTSRRGLACTAAIAWPQRRAPVALPAAATAGAVRPFDCRAWPGRGAACTAAWLERRPLCDTTNNNNTSGRGGEGTRQVKVVKGQRTRLGDLAHCSSPQKPWPSSAAAPGAGCRQDLLLPPPSRGEAFLLLLLAAPPSGAAPPGSGAAAPADEGGPLVSLSSVSSSNEPNMAPPLPGPRPAAGACQGPPVWLRARWCGAVAEPGAGGGRPASDGPGGGGGGPGGRAAPAGGAEEGGGGGGCLAEGERGGGGGGGGTPAPPYRSTSPSGGSPMPAPAGPGGGGGGGGGGCWPRAGRCSSVGGPPRWASPPLPSHPCTSCCCCCGSAEGSFQALRGRPGGGGGGACCAPPLSGTCVLPGAALPALPGRSAPRGGGCPPGACPSRSSCCSWPSSCAPRCGWEGNLPEPPRAPGPAPSRLVPAGPWRAGAACGGEGRSHPVTRGHVGIPLFFQAPAHAVCAPRCPSARVRRGHPAPPRPPPCCASPPQSQTGPPACAAHSHAAAWRARQTAHLQPARKASSAPSTQGPRAQAPRPALRTFSRSATRRASSSCQARASGSSSSSAAAPPLPGGGGGCL